MHLGFPVVCPGLRESSRQVSQIQETYNWILNIPNNNLQMSFQEVNHNQILSFNCKFYLHCEITYLFLFVTPQVLVDLTSKNDRGLYQARIRAVVAGRPLTFYSLVGLENESFYRSVPRIIAVALDTLKT